jgi:hypothetical protein
MPRELASLLENGLWKPRDAVEWRVVLDEIEQRGMERLTLEILRAGRSVPAVRWRALELSANGGDEDAGLLVDADPSTFDAAERIEFAQALGVQPDPAWMDAFRRAARGFRSARARRVPRGRPASGPAQDGARGRRRARPTASIPITPPRSRRWRASRVTRTRATCSRRAWPTWRTGPRRSRSRRALLPRRPAGGTRHGPRAALSADPPPHGAQAVELVRALSRKGTSEDVEVVPALCCRGPRPPRAGRRLGAPLCEIARPFRRRAVCDPICAKNMRAYGRWSRRSRTSGARQPSVQLVVVGPREQRAEHLDVLRRALARQRAHELDRLRAVRRRIGRQRRADRGASRQPAGAAAARVAIATFSGPSSMSARRVSSTSPACV